MINRRIFQPFFKGAHCGLGSVQKEGSPHHKPGRRRKDQWVYFFWGHSLLCVTAKNLLVIFLTIIPPFSLLKGNHILRLELLIKNIISLSTAEDLGTEKKRGKKERVKLVLINGQTFTGNLIIDQPEYRTQVPDAFNAQEKEFLQVFS